MTLTTSAHMAGYEQSPLLASVASVDESGLLWLRAETTSVQAQPWLVEPTPDGRMYTAAAPRNTVGLFFDGSDHETGMAASFIIDRYLDEGHLPHDMLVRPGGPAGWIGIGIRGELNTVTVATGTPGPEQTQQYAYVPFTEYAGSALYVAFRALHAVGPRAIRAVQCRGARPAPFPFTENLE